MRDTLLAYSAAVRDASSICHNKKDHNACNEAEYPSIIITKN